jgi:Na+-driven multidrug efflux pump
MSVPILIIWIFSAEAIFLFIGVEKAVCIVISRCLRIRALSVPIDVLNESYEKYLNAIGVTGPSFYMAIVFNLVLLILCHYFVVTRGLGFEYIPVAFVVATYMKFFVQVTLSLRYEEVRRTLQPWSIEATEGWYEFCALGLPGTVMLCSEWVRIRNSVIYAIVY